MSKQPERNKRRPAPDELADEAEVPVRHDVAHTAHFAPWPTWGSRSLSLGALDDAAPWRADRSIGGSRGEDRTTSSVV